MSKLTAAQRKALPSSAFLDPQHRRFPVNDQAHRKAALTFGISRAEGAGNLGSSQAAIYRRKALKRRIKR